MQHGCRSWVMADRFVHLEASPLAPGTSRVPIYVRDAGRGQPLVFLHGGWGYSIYPFDRQLDAFVCRHRIVIPDRTGYGRSGPLDRQRSDFHRRAADETFAVLDALDVERAVLWGHSDGAVIALRMALSAPARVAAVVAEASHFYRKKPRSRTFFETMRDSPDDLGARVATVLQQEHGDRWRSLISTNGAAWLQIADEALSDTADLYDGRLPELTAPVLILHGAKDPRTEPGEFEALIGALRSAARVDVIMLDEGGHSPHNERATAAAVTNAARSFLT
jgi:pimeloyl-ACP methyl ester carboxylesterase